MGVAEAQKEIGAELGPVTSHIHLSGQEDALAATGGLSLEMTGLYKLLQQRYGEPREKCSLLFVLQRVSPCSQIGDSSPLPG